MGMWNGLTWYFIFSGFLFGIFSAIHNIYVVYVKKGGFDYFTTTLTISPLKNSVRLNEIGLKLSEEYDMPYLLSDFKKKEGYKRSIELSHEYNLYRQNYCGCVYSRWFLYREYDILKQDFVVIKFKE